MHGFWLAAFVAVWILVIVQSVALFTLFHHFGQMYLTSREGRDNHGPDLDRPLRATEATTVEDARVAIPRPGVPNLVLFSDTSCDICAELRPALREFAVENPELATVLVCGGDREAVAAWADGLAEVADVVFDPRTRIAARYGVGLTPFLVAVDEGGVVRGGGLVNDADGLELAAVDAALIRTPATT